VKTKMQLEMNLYDKHSGVVKRWRTKAPSESVCPLFIAHFDFLKIHFHLQIYLSEYPVP